MGAQSVGSKGGGGAVQMHKSQSLAWQGSLYSLTLDEVQTQLGDLGKPLGSMNLDELLKSVWTAEATQAPDNNVVSGSASGLHQQGSLTLSRDLSKKTVDEVWRDIQHKKNKVQEKEKQPILGEITLEDFLFKAGVVTESPNNNNNNNNNKGNAGGGGGVLGVDSIAVPQHSHWTQMQFQLPSVQQPQLQQQQNMMAVFVHHPVQQPPLPVMDAAAYSDTHMTMSPSSLIGALSDTQTPGRKRGATGDVVEKTVERRQKRMIKNRESAARSRARKQKITMLMDRLIRMSWRTKSRVWKRRMKDSEDRRRWRTSCQLHHLPSPSISSAGRVRLLFDIYVIYNHCVDNLWFM